MEDITLEEKVAERLKEIYAKRQKAHDELLKCDIEVDNLIKETLGIK